MTESPMDTLCLPARPESLDRLYAFVLQRLHMPAVPQGLVQKVELVLEELLINVVYYAYPPEAPGDIELSCSVAGGVLHLVIADRGKAFSPLDRPDPDLTASIEDRNVGGLGIVLVKEMVDAIEYQRVDGRNVLTVTIRIEH